MLTTYACPKCQSRTETGDGIAPVCIPCAETMIIVGAEMDPKSYGPDAQPIAPENLAAYQDGLAEIEAAKANADQQEREYLRAKEYASKAKKRLEGAEAELRARIQTVTDRLRPRPLFDQADHHTNEELIAMLAAENVTVTADQVDGWSDAERADARAWVLAQHSEQPRLKPPFLEAAPDDPDGDGDEDNILTAGDADPEEPPTPAPEAPAGEPTHWYPNAGGAK